MNVVELTQVIGDIESRYPVANWRAGDIPLWPIMRVHIYTTLYETYDDQYQGFAPPVRAVGFKRWRHVATRAMGVAWARAACMIRPQPNTHRHYDTVILDNGSSFDWIKGEAYQRLTDPLHQRMLQEGRSVLQLSQARQHVAPRSMPSRFISAALGWAILRARLQSAPRISASTHADIYALQQQLQRSYPNARFQLAAYAAKASRIVAACSHYFQKVLAQTTPQEAYVVCYYNLIGFAFCHACNQHQIPVADIQHGVQSEWHTGYGRWHIPEGGYSVLPSHFACWGEQEVAAIRQWSHGTPHHPYRLGNLYLHALQNGFAAETAAAFSVQLQQVRNTHPHAAQILVSLQSHARLTEALKTLLLRNTSDGAMFFWLRAHPCDPEAIAAINAWLREHNIKNAEISHATHTPLYLILAHMDGHITMNSSVVIEAASMGVPSLILDGSAHHYYHALIEAGSAHYNADSAAGIAWLLQQHANNAKGISAAHAPPETLPRLASIR
jgi:hypothetical protein